MKKQHKKIAIIFDFMRTLYNPESLALYSETLSLLEFLNEFSELHLITRKEGQREQLVEELGIKKFFTSINFLDRKTQKSFQKIINPKKEMYEEIYCIGDVVWEEIMIGNKLGWKTIWLKHGKFGNTIPKEEAEIPWKVITSLYEVKEIFKK